MNRAVAVIVVNWNTPDLIGECLAALRRSEGVRWHLYLVDNASSDDSAERLCNLGEDVTFIQSPVNGGWTGGNNLGVRRALDDGCDRLFMLNSDALVLPDTLARLLDEAERRPTAILGPVQLQPDLSHYNFAGSTLAPDTGMPSLPRSIPLDSDDAAAIADVQPTAYVQGSGLLVSREHFATLGLFDDRFYLNYDDTDFCAKAREHGFEVALVKASRLLHASSVSIGGGESPLSRYFMTRNALLFSRLHTSPRQYRTLWARIIRSELFQTGEQGRLRQAIALSFGRQLRQRIVRRALLDYLFRRFGDCPPLVRQLHAENRAAHS